MSKPFSWHDLPEGFLKWMIVNLMPKWNKIDNELWEQIKVATEKHTNIVLTIQINGIEVDAMKFVDSVKYNMDRAVVREAQRIVEEETVFNEITSALYDLEKTVKGHLRYELRKAGIELLDR